VGECFFWYRLTQVVLNKGPLKRLCVSVFNPKTFTFHFASLKHMFYCMYIMFNIWNNLC